MKEQFITFLKKHKCLLKFSHNVSRDFESLDNYLTIYEDLSDRWVVRAFLWEDTTQGHKFWEWINAEWVKSISPTE